MKLHLIRALLIGWMLAAVTSAHAADWPSVSTPLPASGKGGGEHDVAVIVGIEKYLVVAPVPGASQAADDWYAYFVRSRGTPVGRVHLLRDEEATAEALRDEADWAASQADARGTVWFVFVGHGAPAQDGKDGVLVGADAQQTARSLYARSVAQGELLRKLSAGKQQRTIALIDACFSGKTGEGQQLAPNLQPVIAVKTVAPPKVVVLTAGKSNEFAGPLPGASRPAFSYLALGGLRGWADSDGDGEVTADELTSYARSTLSAVLRDRHQTPEFIGAGGTVLARKATEKGPDVASFVLAKVGSEPSVAARVEEPHDDSSASSGMSALASAGIDLLAMDPSVDPCDDFYSYACGGWLNRTEIPADRQNWSRGFVEVADRNQLVLKDVLERVASGEDTHGPGAKQLGDFYASCMDEAKLESSGAQLKAELRSLEPKDAKSLATVLARMHQRGIHAVFDFGAAPDMKNPSVTIGDLEQGRTTLGLPDRDYYLSTAPNFEKVRTEYLAHLERTFELLGESPERAGIAAKNVLSIENALATASLSRSELNNLGPTAYQQLDGAGLKQQTPGFAWDAYFKELGGPRVDKVNIAHLPFFQAVAKLANEGSPEAWKDYLTWRFVDLSAHALPKKFRDERISFSNKTLGMKEDLPRWKRCTSYADSLMGDALSSEFVQRTLGSQGKQKAEAIVRELQGALEGELQTVSWMDADTRTKARAKLQKVKFVIGYPDQWQSYEGLKIDRGSFLENVLNAATYAFRRNLSAIGKPVDRGEWQLTAATVNAYYDPSRNSLVFPAGILQPPFLNRNAADPVNFGAIGLVMAHELTHGFDDEGAQFDADGNMASWWSKATTDAFSQQRSCVKSQYDGYPAIDDLKVNGTLTLGENVADGGGIKIAYLAMRSWLAAHPSGLSSETADRAFFLGFAQSWCSKYRPENLRIRAKQDPHAPPNWRVNGPLSGLKPFANAFSCHKGQKMVSASPCEVW